MKCTSLTFEDFIENFVNKSIVITCDNGIRHELNTLSYQQIKDIKEQCDRAENNFLVLFHYEYINYFYTIMIGDPESDLDITIDLYTNDQQIWVLEQDRWYFKPTKTYLPVVGRLPNQWDLATMYFKLARWGELSNNPRLKAKYYALSLWLLSDIVTGDFQKFLKNNILQNTLLVNNKPFYDLAIAELEFCRELYFYSPEVKNYASAELIWLSLQYYEFFYLKTSAKFSKKDAYKIGENYITRHRKMISDNSIRKYKKRDFNCLNNELIIYKEVKAEKLFNDIRTILLNDAFEVILENIDDCKDILFQTRKYLSSLAHFNRIMSRNRKYKVL